MVPLHQLKSLMAPLSAQEWTQLSNSGTFERMIDERAVGGSHTEATLRAQFDTTQFVHVAESDLECASMRMSTTMVGSVTIGDVLVGSSLCGFCSVGDDMALHACVAHVVAISSDGLLRLTAVDDVWSLVESIDVDFVHVPANDTADADADTVTETEAKTTSPQQQLRRQRGEPVVLTNSTTRQFTAFSWNYDRAANGAADVLPLQQISDVLGVPATCADCFAALNVGVEFAFRMTLDGVRVPTVHAFKLVLVGEVELSAVVNVTLPLSTRRSLVHDLVTVPLPVQPLVIPIGLLAITIRPSMTLSFDLLATLSNPLSAALGAKQTTTLRAGVQLERGQPLRIVRSVSQQNSIVARLDGFLSPDLVMEARSGIRVGLDLGVGLTLAPLALVVSTPPIITVGLHVLPQVVLSIVPPTPPLVCTLPRGYRVGFVVEVGVTVSPLTITVGRNRFEMRFGGLFPYEANFVALQMPTIPGCSACSGCLGALDALARAVLPLIRGQTMDAPALSTARIPDQSLSVNANGATSLAIGAPLTLRWDYVAGLNLNVQSVWFTAEVRLLAANTTTIETISASNEQFDRRVSFSLKTVQFASLQPFIQGLVPGASKVRLVVVSGDADTIYGKTAWLDVRAPTAASSGAPVRVFGGWTACSSFCGSPGTMTRVASCVTSDGSRSAMCGAAQSNGQALTRSCTALQPQCPFVPFSLSAPRPNSVVATWNADATLRVEFNGGQIGRRTAIRLCNSTVDPCTTTKPNCGRDLASVLPNPLGKTQVNVALGLPGMLVQPLIFSLMLDNGGADWDLSPEMVLRAPDVTFALAPASVAAASGTVNIAAAYGCLSLLSGPRYRLTTTDIGEPVRISFFWARPTVQVELQMTRRLFPPVVYTVEDYRRSRVPGFVVATCTTARICRVCDPSDPQCRDAARDNALFAQRLPRTSCPIRTTQAPPTCGQSRIQGVCQNSRTVACPSPRRYVLGQCQSADPNIQCCPAASRVALLEEDGDLEFAPDEDAAGGSSNESEANVTIIAGSVVGALILIALVMLVVVCVLRRRSAKSFDHVVVENSLYQLK